MTSHKITIATRKSPLALWQAEYVSQQLKTAHPGIEIVLNKMSTQGDKILDTPLAKIGGKGLFVKELEHALLNGSADIAVHSMKDVTVEFPPGLHLPVMCQRENPNDAFVSNHHQNLKALAAGARVGTSSLRRQCQLLAHFPDLEIVSLRGNVNTRLRKLDEGDFDAIILAAAGLIRLGFEDRITAQLPHDICLPAIGQGAVGIECRTEDEQTHQLIAVLNDDATQTCVAAERAVNKRLGGSCQVPIAAYATIDNKTLTLNALVGEPDGSRILHSTISGPCNEASTLGLRVAEDLISQGAEDILDALHD